MNIMTPACSAANYDKDYIFEEDKFGDTIIITCDGCGVVLARWETYIDDGFIVTGWHDTINRFNTADVNLCNKCYSAQLAGKAT